MKKKDLNFPMFSRWIWKTQSQAHLNKKQKSSLQIDKEAPLLIWKWGCSKQKSSRSNFFPNQVTDHNHCSVFAIRKVTFCDDSGRCMSSALRWVTLKQITWQFKEAVRWSYQTYYVRKWWQIFFSCHIGFSCWRLWLDPVKNTYFALPMHP